MTNTTYNADRWSHVDAYAVAPATVGLTTNCQAGQTTTLSYVLTSDVFFRAIEILTMNATLGDTISMQVIDTNGITGAKPGTVVATPVNNWNVATDVQNSARYEAIVPKKIPATFTLNIIYTSTGLVTPVTLAVNYELLNILI